MELLNRHDRSRYAAVGSLGTGGVGVCVVFVLGLFALGLAGCGTTRWTNSPRTGTELLLISNAIDQAVDRMDFSALAGETVYFDPQYLYEALDHGYIISSIRQKLLASGCILKESRDGARYIVEARSGGVGTDQHDVMFGMPSVNVPPLLGALSGVPTSIPEVPLIKKTAQKGVAKLAVFAYERETGRAVWQSGSFPVNSTARDTWVFGAGPFQQGSIYDGTKFAGGGLAVPKLQRKAHAGPEKPELRVTDEADFHHPPDTSRPVQLAGHEEPDHDPTASAGRQETRAGEQP